MQELVNGKGVMGTLISHRYNNENMLRVAHKWRKLDNVEGRVSTCGFLFT
jgi:HKD family nuclease